jgi:hypothetical protein
MSILDSVAEKIDSGELELSTPVAEGWSAYQIAALLNEAIKRFGIDRTPVPPQYVYNLGKNGQIDGIKGKMTGRRFDEATVQKFVEKWVSRNLTK